MEADEISKPRTSIAAVVSLVCGILGCIPFFPGFAAVLLGIVGIAKTGSPRVTGRWMAIVGLLLGLMSVGVWTLGGFGMYAAYQLVATPATELTRDLSEGKIEEALALTVPGTDRATLEAASEKIKPWGAFQSLSLALDKIDGQGVKDGSKFKIGGTATFATGTKNFSIIFMKVGEAYKIEKFEYD
jgi:hypothetical protein